MAGRGATRVGWFAPDRFDGGDDLVTEEPVGVLETAHERVHGRPGRKEGQGGRNVPLHPDVLVRILQRIPQRRDRLVAETDQRFPGRVLQGPVTEPRYQSRQEKPVRNAESTRAPDRLEHHVDLVIVQERHQQNPKAGILGSGSGEGARRLPSSRRGRVPACRRSAVGTSRRQSRTSPSSRERARTAAAATATPGSGSSRCPAIVSAVPRGTGTPGPARNPPSTPGRSPAAGASRLARLASAVSAAARTSTSSSWTIRSTTPCHRSARRERPEANAFSTRTRTLGDS